MTRGLGRFMFGAGLVVGGMVAVYAAGRELRRRSQQPEARTAETSEFQTQEHNLQGSTGTTEKSTDMEPELQPQEPKHDPQESTQTMEKLAAKKPTGKSPQSPSPNHMPKKASWALEAERKVWEASNQRTSTRQGVKRTTEISQPRNPETSEKSVANEPEGKSPPKTGPSPSKMSKTKPTHPVQTQNRSSSAKTGMQPSNRTHPSASQGGPASNRSKGKNLRSASNKAGKQENRELRGIIANELREMFPDNKLTHKELADMVEHVTNGEKLGKEGKKRYNRQSKALGTLTKEEQQKLAQSLIFEHKQDALKCLRDQLQDPFKSLRHRPIDIENVLANNLIPKSIDPVSFFQKLDPSLSDFQLGNIEAELDQRSQGKSSKKRIAKPSSPERKETDMTVVGASKQQERVLN